MSPTYSSLRQRLSELARLLLPPFSPTGQYETEELERTKAYMVLCHAEIENFLEERCNEAVRVALAAWDQSRRSSVILTSLFAYTPCKEVPKDATDHIDNRRKEAEGKYYDLVDSNHGIKSTDVRKLLYRIGIRESDIDPAWLAGAESFGSRRGEVAHKGVARVATTLDPRSLKSDVDAIVEGLLTIDESVEALCSMV